VSADSLGSRDISCVAPLLHVCVQLRPQRLLFLLSGPLSLDSARESRDCAANVRGDVM
jgi:hypothetical protein